MYFDLYFGLQAGLFGLEFGLQRLFDFHSNRTITQFYDYLLHHLYLSYKEIASSMASIGLSVDTAGSRFVKHQVFFRKLNSRVEQLFVFQIFASLFGITAFVHIAFDLFF